MGMRSVSFGFSFELNAHSGYPLHWAPEPSEPTAEPVPRKRDRPCFCCTTLRLLLAKPDISNWSEVSWRSFLRLHRDQSPGSSLDAEPWAFSSMAIAFQSYLWTRASAPLHD